MPCHSKIPRLNSANQIHVTELADLLKYSFRNQNLLDLSCSIATKFDTGQLKFPHWSACIPVTICKIHLLKLAKCICPDREIYLCKFQNVFVQIVKCICTNFKTSKYICPGTVHKVCLLYCLLPPSSRGFYWRRRTVRG